MTKLPEPTRPVRKPSAASRSYSRDAKDGGEPDERIYAVAAWDESPFFTPAERAAFALTESMCRLSEGAPRVPETVWLVARQHFGDEELAQLIMVITTINAWNRVSVTVRMVPESHPAAATT